MNKGNPGRSILLVVVVLLFFFSLSQYFSSNKKNNKANNPSSKAPDEAVQESVNKNLYMTDRKIELEQTHIDSENKFTKKFSVPQLGQKINTAATPDALAGAASSDEEKVYRDLKRDSAEYVYTPAGEVQSQVLEANRVTEQKQRDAEAFVQAYIDNAKAHGYKVRINKDLVVIGVDKINDNRPDGAH